MVRVASLLNSGADIETMDVSPSFQRTDNCPIRFSFVVLQSTTPLMQAAFFGHITTLRLLLDRGAEVDGKDKVRYDNGLVISRLMVDLLCIGWIMYVNEYICYVHVQLSHTVYESMASEGIVFM